MYRDYKDKFGPVFIAEMGADAVMKLLKKIDLEEICSFLPEQDLPLPVKPILQLQVKFPSVLTQ